MKTPTSDDRLIRLIAIFKLFKAGLLTAVGIGVLRLVHQDVAGVIQHWCEALRLDPANHFLDAGLEKVARVRPDQIRKLGLGSFFYAGLFLAEGTGLWLRKRWGEWLTVIITSSLVPLELYEIYRHVSYVKLGVLALNVGIVIYLIYHIRKQR
ncbi:MAG TPA: DUF2127 domain-containing protein [Candidatus Sulfotelmatobacter sp.]